MLVVAGVRDEMGSCVQAALPLVHRRARGEDESRPERGRSVTVGDDRPASRGGRLLDVVVDAVVDGELLAARADQGAAPGS